MMGKRSYFIFLLITGACLAVISCSKKNNSINKVKEEISRISRERLELTPRERAILQIKLAIKDYQARHNGELPKSLNKLVPNYFNTLPLDPETGKPFAYIVTPSGIPKIEPPNELVSKDLKANKKASNKKKKNNKPLSEEDILIASLDVKDRSKTEYYDPRGKRDPFEQFNLAPKKKFREGVTPLEQYPLEQLRVTAILLGAGKPKAIVEDSNGKGYTVEVGTKIGINSGEVVQILKDKIVVLETIVDFRGEKESRTIDMPLKR